MKTLKMTFRSGSHSTRSIQLKYVAEELTPDTVKKAMQDIIALQLFASKGVQLYADPVKAEYVDTNEKTLFTEEN